MVAFYKHDIPAWMDGTEALSDGTYRAYHVICQLIYLNEGPIMLNERGIAGRCNQSMKTFRKHLDELLALGKLSMVDGRISNARAVVELEAVQKNRENAGKGGKISGNLRKTSGNPEKNSGNSGISSGNAERDPDKLLKNNEAGEAALKTNRSLKEKTREEKSRADTREDPVPSGRKPLLDDRTLEAVLREAAGLENDPAPNLHVVGPIHALIGEGYDLDKHIVPVLKALKAKGKRWTNWKYPVAAIREQNAAPSAPAGTAPPPAQDPAKIRRGQLAMAKDYIRDKAWSDSWGPRRGEPGCRLPADIWEEADQAVEAEERQREERRRVSANGAAPAHH